MKIKICILFVAFASLASMVYSMEDDNFPSFPVDYSYMNPEFQKLEARKETLDKRAVGLFHHHQKQIDAFNNAIKKREDEIEKWSRPGVGTQSRAKVTTRKKSEIKDLENKRKMAIEKLRHALDAQDKEIEWFAEQQESFY